MRIVAIDGPAGAGKSTIARALAGRLGVPYLDTGAMYRAIALAALNEGLEFDDAHRLGELAARTVLEMTGGITRLNGSDVSRAIRTPEVNSVVSRVASVSEVRSILRQQQRVWVQQHGGGVVEGRDIGTVVFPDATLKVFLTARPDIRAARRAVESGGDEREVAQSIAERDHLDSSRADSPLAEASEAIIFDTSDFSIEEVVERLHQMVVERESINE